MHRAQFCGKLRSLAMERDGGSASGLAADFNVAPGNSMIPARPDSLHRGFLGGEARGVTLDAVGLRFTIADLGLSKNPMQEAFAEACDGRSDARHFRDVDAGANDHADSLAVSHPLNLQPHEFLSDPPIVGPPILDGFFDVGGREVRGQRPFDQRWHLCIWGKAQGNELAFAELRDLRAQGIGQQRG